MGEATVKRGNTACTYIVGRYRNTGTLIGTFHENVVKRNFNPYTTCNQIDGLLKQVAVKRKYLTGRYNERINLDHRQGIVSDSTANKGIKKSEYITTGTKDAVAKNSFDISSSSMDFVLEGLIAHNAFRCLHGAQMMKIDIAMTKEAESYAEELVTTGKLVHYKGLNVGENLAYGCSINKDYEITAAEATKNW